jgi:hypothetical protein
MSQGETLTELYQRLQTKAIQTKNETIDWQKIGMTITNLPEEHSEIIYGLILHHFYLEKGKIQRIPAIPYFGKVFDSGKEGGSRKGVMYTVSHLPSILQRIIFQYVCEVVAF